MYNGWTESAEQIEARKRRILQAPNLAVDDIPEAGECSPLYYAAMTPQQRAEYDKRLDILKYKRLFQNAMKPRRVELLRDALIIFFAAEAVSIALQFGLPVLFGR